MLVMEMANLCGTGWLLALLDLPHWVSVLSSRGEGSVPRLYWHYLRVKSEGHLTLLSEGWKTSSLLGPPDTTLLPAGGWSLRVSFSIDPAEVIGVKDVVEGCSFSIEVWPEQKEYCQQSFPLLSHPVFLVLRPGGTGGFTWSFSSVPVGSSGQQASPTPCWDVWEVTRRPGELIAIC